MEEDAASEMSDWEVLSAASSCGFGGDDDVVLVSGGGADVLHDHFALAPAAAAPSDAGFSGEESWPESGIVPDEEGQGAELELLDGFDSVSGGSSDIFGGLSSVQLQLHVGRVDETREPPVPQAPVSCGATWSLAGRQTEAIDAEIEQGNNAARICGELDSILQPDHHEVGEPLDSDATTATDVSPQSEVSENSSVQLEDAGCDAGVERSCLEDSVPTDGIHGEQGEQEQGSRAYAASGCDESDGEAKDGSLPLVQNPGAGEGEKHVFVWWRMPLKLLHYCAWKVKPVWSFSIAAALLGLVVLGRRLYRMKRKAKGLPHIKIAFDDKRAAQFADRAARLNEAFLIARRVPMLRTSSGAVLPWSMVQER